MRVPARRTFAALLVALLLPALAPAHALADTDPHQQRADVQAKRAQTAAKVDVLKASDDKVQGALDTLDSNVSAQQGALLSAQQQEHLAALDAITAERARQEAQDALHAAQEGLRRQAIQAYTHPDARVKGSSDDDLTTIALRQQYLHVANGTAVDQLSRVRAAQLDLQAKESKAKAAAKRTADRSAAVQARLGSLKTARDQQNALADSYEQRLAAARSELGGLDATDAALASQIAKDDAARAAKERASRSAPPSGSGGSNDGGGGGGGGPVSISTGSGGLSTVRGITVASSIAGNLAALLNASDAAGLSLSGGGWRSSDQQIALRKAHCDGDVYGRPASACHPPTAKPGSSMHERGLAIDFTNGGSLISSRGNPAYKWLAGNASRFGFYNLPSEPWHWSVNGN